VTECLFLDTEFDQNVACRITVVNSAGHLVIDTLVKQEGAPPHRQTRIHGITDKMLEDAPSLQEVVIHLLEICGPQGGKTVFVAHGGRQDLKCLSLFNCHYIDT